MKSKGSEVKVKISVSYCFVLKQNKKQKEKKVGHDCFVYYEKPRKKKKKEISWPITLPKIFPKNIRADNIAGISIFISQSRVSLTS